MELKYLEPLMKRGSDFLQCKYPILCGAMTWVSEPNLVAAVCNSGCFGCLAGGNAPTDILRQQIEQTRALTSHPFAVNLITIAPAYLSHLAMLREVKVPYIIFAGSFPKEKEVIAAKETGAKVLCFASTVSIAERMIKFGADAIILEGSEAGGHIGHVSSVVLMQQVLFRFADQIPMFCAGGIATGKMIAHTLLMGAAGAQLGTRFVMTEEFGKLQLSLLKKLEAGEIHRQEAQEQVEKFWIGALRKAAVEGDTEMGSLMAGQSVGLVDKVVPIRELVNELLTDAEKELELVRGKLS